MLFGARGGGSDVSHVDDALYRRDKPGGTVGYPAQPGLTWRNHRLPSQTRINSFLCDSVCQ